MIVGGGVEEMEEDGDNMVGGDMGFAEFVDCLFVELVELLGFFEIDSKHFILFV